MGARAGVCYGSDVSDDEKNRKRGIDCLKSGHGRVQEFVNIETIIDGYSARVIREWYTHLGGSPTRLQESTRYCKCEDFEYITPKILNDKNTDISTRASYISIMKEISETYKYLIKNGISKEDAANILPLGMTTKIVDKRNLRNLIDMSHQRMCASAYWEYRQLFNDFRKALSKISDEWKYIVDNYFCPKCDLTGVCNERKSCGRHDKENSK